LEPPLPQRHLNLHHASHVLIDLAVSSSQVSFLRYWLLTLSGFSALHHRNCPVPGCFFGTHSSLCFLRPIHDGKHLFALEDLFLQESLCHVVQGIAVLGQDASRLLMSLCYQPLDLDIQALCLERDPCGPDLPGCPAGVFELFWVRRDD